MSAVTKPNRELAQMDFEDHLWHLKSYDVTNQCRSGEVALRGLLKAFWEKLLEIISRPPYTIFFANFKKSHLQSRLHF